MADIYPKMSLDVAMDHWQADSLSQILPGDDETHGNMGSHHAVVQRYCIALNNSLSSN